MNNDLEFKSIEDLYNRIKPALSSKVSEFKKLNKTYIKEEDIWNYLVEHIWKNQKDLSLAEMTSDILNVDELDIDEYVFEGLKKEERKANLENDELL